MVEPWLRGTLTEVDTVRRGVLHALELAREDVARWCGELTVEELEARPFGLPSVGFQMRHMVRSLDRLLTYAEGRQLSEEQLALLKSEMESGGRREDLFAEFERGIESAMERVRAIGPAGYEEARGVGRKMLPTSVGGLLVHCADHTQRHVGQAVTTAKVVRGAG
jgi:DinB superfamily